MFNTYEQEKWYKYSELHLIRPTEYLRTAGFINCM